MVVRYFRYFCSKTVDVSHRYGTVFRANKRKTVLILLRVASDGGSVWYAGAKDL